jgi:hypothetical protein
MAETAMSRLSVETEQFGPIFHKMYFDFCRSDWRV